MKKLLAVVAAATLMLLTISSPAQASEPDLHPDVEYALDAVPGGRVIDAYTVVWPELGMTLTAQPDRAGAESRTAVGSCATGLYCAYSGANRAGTKLSFVVCTVVSTAALSSVGSIANARSSGIVYARNSSATVIGSAAAGSWANVPGGTATLRCTL